MITDHEIREAFERGREAVSIGWEWARGQLYIEHCPRFDRLHVGVVTHLFDRPGEPLHGIPSCALQIDGQPYRGTIVPDFRCPGTRGHLLDQVRRAWPTDVSQWPNNEPAWTIAEHGYIPCPDCNGEGAVMRVVEGLTHEDDCERCGGTGEIQSHEITGWVCGVPGGQQFTAVTEVEALLAARKAAPK